MKITQEEIDRETRRRNEQESIRTIKAQKRDAEDNHEFWKEVKERELDRTMTVFYNLK